MRTPQPLDTSEVRAAYVLRTADGGYVRVSAAARALLEKVERGASFEEIARSARRGGQTASAADVEASYLDLLARLGASEAAAKTRLPPGFWLRLPLLPPALVAPVARRLSGAFDPRVAPLAVGLIAVAALLAGRSGALALEGDHFWAGYGVFLLALVAHELGHASACARFGAPPGEIGLVAYLVYPSFYSRVSSAWTLRRAERVVVDLGGVYFELVFAALCVFVYAATGWAPLRTALALIAASCLVSLNPILRFDGYWVVADALGVTNLSRQVPRLVKRLWTREPSPWPRWVAIALVLYSVALVVFWGFFARSMVPQLAQIAARAPALVRTTASEARAGRLPGGSTLGELATTAYLSALATVTVARIARWAAKLRTSSLPMPMPRPARAVANGDRSFLYEAAEPAERSEAERRGRVQE
jgi:putative peptide zinc metalloprotease protein